MQDWRIREVAPSSSSLTLSLLKMTAVSGVSVTGQSSSSSGSQPDPFAPVIGFLSVETIHGLSMEISLPDLFYRPQNRHVMIQALNYSQFRVGESALLAVLEDRKWLY